MLGRRDGRHSPVKSSQSETTRSKGMSGRGAALAVERPAVAGPASGTGPADSVRPTVSNAARTASASEGNGRR